MPLKQITWMPEQFPDSRVAFIRVHTLEDIDAIIRFIRREPTRVNGFSVQARVSKSAMHHLSPPLRLKFSIFARCFPLPRFPQFVEESAATIASDAGLPDPIHVDFDRFDQSSGDATCYVYYSFPAQAEAFLAHCQQRSTHLKLRDVSHVDCRLESRRQ